MHTHTITHFFSLISRLVLIIFCSLVLQTITVAQKISAETVLENHLKSIGDEKERVAITNQVFVSSTQFQRLRMGGEIKNGKGVLASEGNKVLIGMTFANSPDYPFDRISYDGKELKTSFVSPGVRSALSNFVLSFKDIFREGLFGGTLSSAWSLKNLSGRKAKIEYDGAKKLDGREVLILDYLPKGGSDLKIKLFFDRQTFRHIKTEYRRVIYAEQGLTPDDSARKRETRYLMTEDFSEFEKVKNLTLPYSYKIYLSIDGQNGTSEFEWKMKLEQASFNQTLPATAFDIEAVDK